MSRQASPCTLRALQELCEARRRVAERRGGASRRSEVYETSIDCKESAIISPLVIARKTESRNHFAWSTAQNLVNLRLWIWFASVILDVVDVRARHLEPEFSRIIHVLGGE